MWHNTQHTTHNTQHNTMFTVRILFPDVDAKFDAKFTDAREAINVQNSLSWVIPAEWVCLIPPRDHGKTRFVRTSVTPVFTLTQKGRGWLIQTNRPEAYESDHLLYLTNDRSKSAVWDEASGGWIVNRRDKDAAEQFVQAATA